MPQRDVAHAPLEQRLETGEQLVVADIGPVELVPLAEEDQPVRYRLFLRELEKVGVFPAALELGERAVCLEALTNAVGRLGKRHGVRLERHRPAGMDVLQDPFPRQRAGVLPVEQTIHLDRMEERLGRSDHGDGGSGPGTQLLLEGLDGETRRGGERWEHGVEIPPGEERIRDENEEEERKPSPEREESEAASSHQEEAENDEGEE
jgi:hypothetical protein